MQIYLRKDLKFSKEAMVLSGKNPERRKIVKKRLLTVFMLICMLGFMMAGCGSDSASGDSGGDGADADSAKFEEEGVTVTWWLVGGSEEYYQTYWSEMKSMQAIQEATGITIEFQIATSYDDYLPMMTTEDYADIVTGQNLSLYPGRMAGLYDDGVSIDLTAYLDEYMPNFKQIIEDYPTLAKDIRLDDGEYTFLSTFYDIYDEEDRMASSTNGLTLRQDWLDAVGLDVPTTMDEWYEVLTAFKTQDPNGNGEQDEVPMCMASSGWKYFLTAYGIDDDPSIMTDEDGNSYVVYGYVTDAYKEYLAELNKWYTDGLFGNMFEDTYMENQSDVVLNNIAGAWKGSYEDFDESDSESYISELKNRVPDAELVAAPWPKTADGEQWCYSDINSFNKNTTVITSNAVKNGTDKAAAWLLDYMLSEEGSNYVVWGIEGESYEIMDGEKTLTDGMEESVEYEGATILAFNQYADPLTVAFPCFGEISEYIMLGQSEEISEARSVWAQGDTSYKMPASIQLNVEQDTKVEDYKDNMLDYLTKMREYFITGKQPLTNYDTYVSNAERMGATDYTEVWQEAYDNYLER